MAVDVIGNNFHGVEKPNDYFRQIDDRKKARAEKVENDFNKALKTEKAKVASEVAKTSLRASEGRAAISGDYGDHYSRPPEIAASPWAPRNDVTSFSKASNGVAGFVNDKSLDKNGTDLALKRVAEDFEKQILGIMWNLAFATVDREFQGGLGEEIFHKELVNEMVKLSNTGEMGDIAQSIYRDLKAKEAVRHGKNIDY